MATSAIRSFLIAAGAPAAPRLRVRRQITPQAGRALEILGHAIEYLADEFVHSGAEFSASHPQVQAVQLLMVLNRRVYYECPVVPAFSERCRRALRHLWRAAPGIN